MRLRTAGIVTAATALLVAGAVRLGTAGSAAAAECTGDPLPSPTVAAQPLRTGFTFTEGPTWVADPGVLLFSDMQNPSGAEGVQASTIWRFTPPATFEEFIPDAGSNGLAVDGDRIVAATHDQRSLSTYALSDRSRGVLAAGFQGRKFNSPNDVTIAADGTIYFTDPNFQRANRPDEQSGVTGVYRLRNGVVDLIDGTVAQPNGIALSPDGTTLYVGGLASNQIFAYPVQADGSVGPRRNFARLTSPDGVGIDCAGNLYWASYNDGRVHVITPGGTEIGSITAGRNTTNVAFGGPLGKTLFITSGTSGNFGIYSVELPLAGHPY
ncbi:SMP-30/gluconolactonase/LRE family protein [Paractinoplanes rishiriensis]|uniref:Gluconolactonase n=1 Tax=Paractinoplanes rishiriensis TaxID=1050105 RepID=A0A919MWQ4_9ACTN|nr:SMP-30/gluconolactonase/LRE family protein [Actinoplanes rishiriensis]GIE97704.1 gluconolactonase [Actinoplanes rishiriensis]